MQVARHDFGSRERVGKHLSAFLADPISSMRTLGACLLERAPLLVAVDRRNTGRLQAIVAPREGSAHGPALALRRTRAKRYTHAEETSTARSIAASLDPAAVQVRNGLGHRKSNSQALVCMLPH